MKYGNVTLGQVEAVWNKFGGQKGIDRLLGDELVICEKGSKKAKELKRAILAPDLPSLITACHLDWFNKDILSYRREDQPLAELGETEVLHFGRAISTAGAEKEIVKRGYRRATVEELLDRGTKDPDEQRRYPIIALGSVFVDPRSGYRFSPYLSVLGSLRLLRLDYRDHDWSAYCRFLVVRK